MSEPGAEIRTALELSDAALSVRLGCEAWERLEPQPVRVDLRIEFSTAPRACESDALADTVCYAELTSRLRASVQGVEFRLVERLAQVLYQVVRDVVPPTAAVELDVAKLRPPVEALRGPVRFRIRG